MSIDTELRATTPAHVPPLDHARLQRAGRRRRQAAYSGVAMAVIAIGGLGIAAVTSFVPQLPEVAPLGPPASAPEDTQKAEAAPDVVATYGSLSHDQALDELLATLEATPERPTDLTSIEQSSSATSAGIPEFEELRGDETNEDFPVITVADPDFDPTAGDYETPAFLPTWDQDTARLALEALSNSTARTYAGVATDALGRTVLVFESNNVHQEVHVDPMSGYTTGVYLGGGVRDNSPDQWPTPFDSWSAPAG